MAAAKAHNPPRAIEQSLLDVNSENASAAPFVIAINQAGITVRFGPPLPVIFTLRPRD